MKGFGASSRDLTIDVRDLIRDYIRSYPTGITIIKEFIQNADDAGATELSVILDCRTHPAGALTDSRMERMLGPALLFRNDALFTEADHKGITTLLNSGKRRESGKIGRFGIGFNCCYNVTDFPSYISGPDIVCLDPCYAAVRSEGDSRTIREQISNLWTTDSAWLRTFECVGVVSGCSDFRGTAFRLPLRMERFQAPDPITPKTLSFADFDSIVSDLKLLGPQLLLFTKHLLYLSVGSIGESETNTCWRLRVTSPNAPKIVKARRSIVDALKGEPREVLSSLRLNAKAPLIRYVHDFEILSDEFPARKESWIVIGGLFRGKRDRLLLKCEEMLDLNEKAIPLAGCAAKLSSEPGVEKLDAVAGKFYCGLPINRDTPLPFHVNAYFDTDSSRTDITRAGEVKGDDVKRAEWNLLLIEDAVAACAADLVTTLVTLRPNTDAEALYRVFPGLDAAEPFKQFAQGFYKDLTTAAVIRSETSNKVKWVAITDAWLVPTRILEPMIAEGLVVAVPELPTQVKLGFVGAGAILNQLDPQKLRAKLLVEKDIDCEISNAPRASLQKREWIQDLLMTCPPETSPSEM